MKIALYIEDGLEQIILTPTDDAEKAILGKLNDGALSVEVHRGQFYFGLDRAVHSAPKGWTHGFDSTYLFLRKIVAERDR